MRLEEKLFLLRKKSGMSQDELADAIDVSRQSISKWEAGKSVPSIESLVAISEMFHVSVDYLVKDDEMLGVDAEAGEKKIDATDFDEWGDESKTEKTDDVNAAADDAIAKEKQGANYKTVLLRIFIVIIAIAAVVLWGIENHVIVTVLTYLQIIGTAVLAGAFLRWVYIIARYCLKRYNDTKKILPLVLVAALLAEAGITNVSTDGTQSVALAATGESGSVTFSNLEDLGVGESIEREVASLKATISLERAADEQGDEEDLSITVWKVSYTGGVINCHFYMTVSDNKVTSVYDRHISTFGGAYDDEVLTSTSAYGKLTFGFRSFLGLVSETCWLRGTVTGNNNEITITYQM